MSSDIAINVINLSKCYQIYEQPRDRLKQFVLPRFRKLLHLQSRQYYREFWALKDVSFEINKGETVGIIGRNGSGKSTLLQMICGTLNQTNGHVETRGRVAALLELGSGFNPEFTGRENVYLNGAVLGLQTHEIDERFQNISDFAEIGDFIDQPVKTYSSGMMVRLAFAVIAHVDADILVVDEALSVGDAFFTQKCMRFLRNFMKSGTVLFVSHDTGAVINLCNKAMLLENGRLTVMDTPEIVTKRYLAAIYEENQQISGFQFSSSNGESEAQTVEEYRDMRMSVINQSTLRNDIEVFTFDPMAEGFGTGLVEIINVRLLDRDNVALAWIVGGEDVVLEIICQSKTDLLRPIVGFQFKDRLGQVIFADNTYLTYQHRPIIVKNRMILVARFEFRMPVLPTGDYSINAAVADGTQDNHVQHHWRFDALSIRSHASSICVGLVGIPMRSISMRVQ